jgi:hypothetical protein
MSVTGDFAQTNTCGASLAAHTTCAVSVTFQPTPWVSEPATCRSRTMPPIVHRWLI